MAMSMVEKLLSDAKKLSGRLKDRDILTDKVISTTMGVHQKLQAMKQYQEHVERLNKAASHRPKSLLIQRLNKMNNKIEELNKDNSELQQSLEDHQETLELIMSKFKEQTDKLNSTSQLEASSLISQHNSNKDLEEKDLKIKEMASVMLVACDHWEEDEEVSCERQRLITLLQQKNRMMRMVLLNTTDEMLKSESSVGEDNLTSSLKNIFENKQVDTKENIENSNHTNTCTKPLHVILDKQNTTPTTSDLHALNIDNNNNTCKNIDDINNNTLHMPDLTTPTLLCDDNVQNKDSTNKNSTDVTNTSAIKTSNDSLQKHVKQTDKMSGVKAQVYIYSEDSYHEDSNSETETLCDDSLSSDFSVSLVTLS